MNAAADVEARIQAALARHRAGDAEQADWLYRLAIALAPAHAEARHLRGLLLLETGRAQEALTELDAATALAPTSAAFHDARANALEALGRMAEAIAAWRAAVRLDPALAAAWVNLGAALAAGGDPAAAESCHRRALALEPANLPALVNLATALMALGRPAEAEASLRAALAVAPDHPVVLHNLARALGESGRIAEAIAPIRRLLATDPANRETWRWLVELAARAGRIETVAEALAKAGPAAARDGAVLLEIAEALLHFRQPAAAEPVLAAAIALDPGAVLPLLRQVRAAAALGRPEEAQRRLDQVEAAARARVAEAPNDAVRLGELALVLGEAARFAEAASITSLLAPHTDDPIFRQTHAEYLLGAGRLAEGWAARIIRLSGPGTRILPHPAPLWDGTLAPGRVLLITADDGFGDFLQFARLVPHAAARCRVVLAVPASMVRLASSLAGPERVVAIEDGLPAADLRCPVMGLPHLFPPTEATLPGPMPYLHADAADVAAWRARLGDWPGRKIGLVWQGDPRLNFDLIRSIPAAALGPLAEVPGVTWVSAQIGAPAPPWLRDVAGELRDWADTAALVTALDLFISIDSGPVHLAGALARPVWLLNRFSTEWRWQAGRADSPYYPTLRIFRQPRPGDWGAVIAEVCRALSELP